MYAMLQRDERDGVFSPCFAPTFLADLHVSNVGGERHIQWGRDVVWSRPSCHDRPTNFLVLPTLAKFSAH